MTVAADMVAVVLRRLASLWLTLACLVGLASMLAWRLGTDRPIGWDVALPLGLLCLNLAAALVVTPALRRQPGLLVFHLGLALLALLLGAGRLMSAAGNVEVTEGLALDPALVTVAPGPLHRFRLPAAAFVQGPFSIDYAPGLTRGATTSRVVLADGREAVVGDDVALVINGYRLYTTHNKGFAPLLSFRRADGGWMAGSLHLPSYPLFDYNQGTEWTPPGAAAPLTLWLKLDKPVHDKDARWTFRTPDDPVLVVDDGTRRHELRPGGELAVAGGRLRFEELRTWMGYSIDYDPSRPWLLAAGGIAVAGLLWHGLAKVAAVGGLAGKRRGCGHTIG